MIITFIVTAYFMKTGNANTENRHLVAGFGATMMLHATLTALSQLILEVYITHANVQLILLLSCAGPQYALLYCVIDV